MKISKFKFNEKKHIYEQHCINFREVTCATDMTIKQMYYKGL